MSGKRKRKSETIISAAHEEKKPKDSQSIIVHSSGATSTNTMTTPTSFIQNSPQTLLNTTNSPPGTQQPKKINSIKATPLQPGQPIPSGTSVFMSGGKTYCIPKESIIAQQHHQHKVQLQQQQPSVPQTSTPALPLTPLQNVFPISFTATPSAVTPGTAPEGGQGQQTPTIGTIQAQNPQGQKQMVGVKSLGLNTVTFKGNQMIVSGPVIAQAQLIAKQLSSGAAKLATLNGKQVLISTTPLSNSDTNGENLKSDTEKNNNSIECIEKTNIIQTLCIINYTKS